MCCRQDTNRLTVLSVLTSMVSIVSIVRNLSIIIDSWQWPTMLGQSVTLPTATCDKFHGLTLLSPSLILQKHWSRHLFSVGWTTGIVLLVVQWMILFVYYFSVFSDNVAVIVSISLLISSMALLLMCVCCYPAPSDDDSIDGILVEQQSDKSLSSASRRLSASSIR